MKIKKFSFEHFKGINKAEINLSKSANANVFTLVGPNECGKTTVLEAIHSLKFDTENQAVLEGIGISETSDDFVRIGDKGSFNGEIKLEAVTLIEDWEKDFVIDQYNKKFGHFLIKESIPDELTFIKVHAFSNGDYVESESNEYWEIAEIFKIREKMDEGPKELDTEASGDDPEQGDQESSKIESNYHERDLSREEWDYLDGYLSALLPKILYFPNLLSRFPDKIYLDNEQVSDASQKEINSFYLKILQDVLVASKGDADNDLNIKDHILDRLKSGTDDNKQKVQNLLSSMGTRITKDIQKDWNEIFSKNEDVSDQKIVLQSGLDKKRVGDKFIERYYISFLVNEDSKDYLMKQRSLGFRWFFCFFLFTIYRAQKDKSIIFLFDEPASNLHPKAQTKLLESLTKISETGAIIIYSTHSHHLIKPAWLEGAYVVRNKSADYELAADVRPESTDIQILPYRQFLEKDAGKTTYFQPIMDALDYRPSEIEKVNLAVLVEGKRDFYYLKYLKDVIFEDEQEIDFMPGRGAGSLGPLISLYQGWGKSFIILLDGDCTGNKERKIYNEQHYVPLDRIFTLEDFDHEFKGIAAEKLFNPKDISDLLGVDEEIIKKNIGKHKKKLTFKIQELLAGSKTYDFSNLTNNNFRKVLNSCYEKF